MDAISIPREALRRIGARKIRRGDVAHGSAKVRGAVEGGVVQQHRNAIGGELDIDLHGFAPGIEGGANARERVGGGFSGGGGVTNNEGRHGPDATARERPGQVTSASGKPASELQAEGRRHLARGPRPAA